MVIGKNPFDGLEYCGITLAGPAAFQFWSTGNVYTWGMRDFGDPNEITGDPWKCGHENWFGDTRTRALCLDCAKRNGVIW